ncbi:MAG: rSAM-modified peptide [Bacteroidales bacterium]|jgi:natural product precursor|nr:rSAM-modified peptide [Bacteroidales bacterium]
MKSLKLNKLNSQLSKEQLNSVRGGAEPKRCRCSCGLVPEEDSLIANGRSNAARGLRPPIDEGPSFPYP